VSGPLFDLSVDVHCHTTTSDDAHDSLAAVIAAARARGLTALSVTDHVRASTTWLPAYVEQVRRAGDRAGLRVTCGVEAKILDTAGRVDLPRHLDGIEQVTISDHQYPGPDGPVLPEEVRRRLAEGETTAAATLEQLVEATARAVSGYQAPVVGHLFSILPKIGVDEALVSDGSLEQLAEACRAVDAAVEVNEKWSTPSFATVERLVALGVRLEAGSDAHRAEDVGRYRYVADVAHGRPGPEQA
jgi:putative hydrolase